MIYKVPHNMQTKSERLEIPFRENQARTGKEYYVKESFQINLALKTLTSLMKVMVICQWEIPIG